VPIYEEHKRKLNRIFKPADKITYKVKMEIDWGMVFYAGLKREYLAGESKTATEIRLKNQGFIAEEIKT